MSDDSHGEFSGWAVLELMGHRKLVGYVQPATLAGAGVLRVDVPGSRAGDPPIATQFYAPAALYCLTPIEESLARRLASRHAPEPVARWELPSIIEPTSPTHPGLSGACFDGECILCNRETIEGEPCGCECHGGVEFEPEPDEAVEEISLDRHGEAKP